MRTIVLRPASERLTDLRERVARVHREVLAAERVRLERDLGRIPAVEYLRLLTQDPTLAWVRPLGRLVAGMDAVLADARKTGAPVEEQELDGFRVDTRRLLGRPLPGEFTNRYLGWLREEPSVVLAHAAVMTLLRRDEAPLAAA